MPSLKDRASTSPVGWVTWFVTVTVIVAVFVLPAASRAVAERECVPLETVVESQETEYGDDVSSEPMLFPSALNCTPETPTLSEAVAESVTVPETDAPLAGEVIETDGRMVSGAVHT